MWNCTTPRCPRVRHMLLLIYQTNKPKKKNLHHNAWYHTHSYRHRITSYSSTSNNSCRYLIIYSRSYFYIWYIVTSPPNNRCANNMYIIILQHLCWYSRTLSYQMAGEDVEEVWWAECMCRGMHLNTKPHYLTRFKFSRRLDGLIECEIVTSAPKPQCVDLESPFEER